MLGYPPEQWYGGGSDPWENNLHADDRERVLAESARTYTEERDFACEYRMHAADGRVVWIAERETIVRDEHGCPCFCHGVMFDITRLKTAEQRLSRQRRRCARSATWPSATSTSPARCCSCSTPTARCACSTGTATSCSATRPDRWSAATGSGPCCRPRRPPRCATSSPRPCARRRGPRTTRASASGSCSTPPGNRRTIAWRHTLLRDAEGNATGALASGEDITDRLLAEAEVRRLAYHDPLTGLANRMHFDAELHAAVASEPAVGLLFIDLDDFKLVNDTLGHAAGDELLRDAGKRLAAVPGARLVGRHGGDEFLVLVPGPPAAAQAAAAAVDECLTRPFAISGHEVRLRASVGCASFPHDAPDADALLRAADAAMYRVKRRSRAWEAGR